MARDEGALNRLAAEGAESAALRSVSRRLYGAILSWNRPTRNAALSCQGERILAEAWIAALPSASSGHASRRGGPKWNNMAGIPRGRALCSLFLGSALSRGLP
jgi:hypothetical protein